MRHTPASFAQQGMWIGERLGAGPAYRMPLALWLDGDLNVKALLAACDDVIARHPVLATTVEETGDGLRQIPARDPSVTLTEALDPEALDRLVRDEIERGFDLAGPLARFTLFTLAPAGPARHLLLFVAHHLVFDGLSKDILVNDLARYYAARAEGETPPPAPPLSFAEAVQAEHEHVRQKLPAAREFWTERWTEPEEIALPGQRHTDRPYGPGEQIDGGIDRALGLAAGAVAEATGATTFEVLLAATHALLFRYGTENVAVAIDVTTRGPETRDLIGPFVTELPTLSHPAPDQTFHRFVQDVRAELREMYRFREVPLARTVNLSPRGALPSVSISYRRRRAEPTFPGLDLSVDWMMFGGGVRGPLHFQYVDGPDGLAVCLRFNPGAIDRDTAVRFADGLRALLASAAGPGVRLADLDVLSPAELSRVLTDWNDTAVAYAAAATLPALFAEQVRDRPDDVAVTFEGRSTSFAELDTAAGRLARRLRSAGVGRGDLVAVHLGRSDLLPAALLAVHRAGAAYLPLDPDHPAERLAMIVADARPRLLLSETADPAGLPAPVLVVGEEIDEEIGEEDERAANEPLPEEVAYVIYTSGSTGRPKGVVVEHRSLANLLLAMRDRLGSGPADTWLALTSSSFDISALELFLPLSTGGRVVVAPQGAVRRPEALARMAADEGVTHVQATPSVWRLLLPGGITGTTALTGGEPLPPGLARELRQRFDRFLNVYGPTETTIWSTYGEPDEKITIGRPIANTRIYLLDAALRPVPVGVAGELCIAGDGVARGYRGRPGLTAERFVPDPYGPPGSRLYRTGDLARYRGDGEIEFLGRRDGQVKLLGHRIELGEIETRLLDHPGVRAGAVVLRGGDAGDPRLTAYVVPAPGTALDPGELTAHLARTLPSAMLPSGYVMLDALPLTPVGKLDRAALPDTAGTPGRVTGSGPHGPPADAELAEEVRRTWREALGLAGTDAIGADDDLFDLGGHSLTIAQITARIRERLGVDVSLDAVFDAPTINGMVEEIVRLGGDRPRTDEASHSSTPSAAARPRADGVRPPLSPAQERLWFLQRLDPGDASYNTCLVLRLHGPLDTTALGAALDAVVARHESLRTSFADVDGEPVTVLHPPAPFPVEHLDLTASADPEQHARQLVAERTNAPFDLAEASPARFSLLALGPDDHVLCLVLHHIIADGWSHGVLFDDLFEYYQARVEGREAVLRPMPVQFGDIALWQREMDSGPAAGEALEYWLRRLNDPPRLELPTDGPGGERAQGAFHTFQIPEEVVDSLERLAQRHGASLFMVLVAAYQVLLARHSGQTDVLVGTTWAARDRVELEPVIGYLTDTLVLRGDLVGDPAFSDLLDATRRTVLEAHAHRIMPFERLVGELGLPRDIHRNPLLSTMVILHRQAGYGAVPERVGELAVKLFDDGLRQAKFDLALETWRTNQGLNALLTYDATLFQTATVKGLAARFAVLLRAVADDPQTPISRLPMLTEADTAVLPRPDPEAGRDEDKDGETVPALFARVVAASPQATALVCGTEHVGYAELDTKVARLAAVLRRHGVGAGDVVGVCMGRAVDAVVTLLAVWRAGGAYLPLDPEYPDERLAFLIADSGARLVVTAEPLIHRLPAGTTLVTLDEATDRPESGDDRLPVATDPAYVIYTSGSTGSPKGVLVEHGALAGRVRWMREAYGLGSGDRVAQFASLSFDAHAEELYPALAGGASVLLLPGGAPTLPDVLRTPDGARVTVLDLPTAYWHRLTEGLDDVTWPEPLRLVVIGGEQAHAAAVARWRALFGDRVRLVNTYGPTEATVIATAATLGAADTVRLPSIGRPIGGAAAHVLGRYGEPVPPGVPGELYLGGAGLARGYPGHPALTAERFVPDPYGRPGSRLYRTGDRVRRRPNGDLEFLGRFDGQVKVRGFRVEPGEVTTALLAHPGVRQAAVTADGDRLVAYLVGSAAPDEVRRHLAATLPAHLVPSGWVSLDELPLTVTGKVDLAALPAPGPLPAAEFVPPRTEAEVLVAEVWQRVLGSDVDRVGALDDFFAVGGHSLLATRVAALLRNAIDVDVPIRMVFDHPTVAELAAAVEQLLIEQLSVLSDVEAVRLLGAEESHDRAI